MSEPLVILVPHSLGRREATRRLKAGLARASDFPSFKFDHLSWSGDRVTFELSGMGQKASGTATVGIGRYIPTSLALAASEIWRAGTACSAVQCDDFCWKRNSQVARRHLSPEQTQP